MRRASSRGKIKLLAIMLVALVVGGAAGGFVVKSALARKQVAKSEKENAKGEGSGESKEEKKEVRAEESEVHSGTTSRRRYVGQIVNLGEFLVNVSSRDRLRYVKCEIAIQVIGLEEGKKKKKGHGEKEEGPLTEEQLAWVKDAVIRVFADTPFESLRTSAGREKLRKRLAVAIEEALDGPAVRQVLFTSFVMQ